MLQIFRATGMLLIFKTLVLLFVQEVVGMAPCFLFKFKKSWYRVITVIMARSKDLVILEDDFRADLMRLS